MKGNDTMKKELVCISCPIGCHITVSWQRDDLKDLVITGNRCPRGLEYARAEVTAPARVVTATVATGFPDRPRLPVKTTAPFPVEDIPRLLNILKNVFLDMEIAPGDVVIPDALDSGIDVVATSRIP